MNRRRLQAAGAGTILLLCALVGCTRPLSIPAKTTAPPPSRQLLQQAAALGAIDGGVPNVQAAASEADAGPMAIPRIDPQTAPKPTVYADDQTLRLTYPVWAETGAGDNVGLSVRYRQEPEQTWTQTKVEPKDGQPKDGQWEVTFPERPEAGSTLRIEATYRFSVSQAQRVAVEANAAQAARNVLTIVIDAYREAKKAHEQDNPRDPAKEEESFQEALGSRSDEIDRGLTVFDGFWTDDGVPARAVLLSALGFKLDAEGTGWSLALADLGALLEVDALSRFETVAEVESERTRLAQASDAGLDACQIAIRDSQPGAAESGIDVLRACAPAGTDLDDANSFATQQFATVAELNSEFVALAGKLGGAGRLDTSAYGLLLLKVGQIERLKLTHAATLVASLNRVHVVVQDVKPTDYLLAMSARRRYYDFSTGLVYVGLLDDVIIPTMLSICPLKCLKPEKGDADYYRTWHTLSLDLGVKAAILDKHADRRHDGAIGILAGASYNPIDVVRLSLGAYLFENRQSDDWNLSFYAGITVNALHAGELLGGIGLADVPKAKLTPAK